jgi:serine protease Do
MSASQLLASRFSDEAQALAEQLNRVLVTVRSRAGGGSGTAWSRDGVIVTNNHVVPEDTAVVVLHDGREFEGRVEARDPEHDLALLRVKAELSPVEPGDPASIRPGSLVFAIGNPWGQRGTLTSGVVLSNHGATDENPAHVSDVIRADLRLAPGNSGGPLGDALGRIVGINCMITGGMAVAIPVQTVQHFIEGSEPGEPGFLGISILPVRIPQGIAASYELEAMEGLMLTGIEPGSPAELAGLIPGDVMLSAGAGRHGIQNVAGALQSMRAGRKLQLSLLRGGHVLEVAATPASRN